MSTPENPFPSASDQPEQPGEPAGQPYPAGHEPYGTPAPDPYGTPVPAPYQNPQAGPYPPQPGYPPQYAAPLPTDGTAIASMVIGIAALVLSCGYGFSLLLSPVALFLGRSSTQRIDASGGTLGGRGMAQAGFIMGIIGTGLLAVGVLIVVALLIILAVTSAS